MKQTYEDVVRIPEYSRTSEQQRIVAEHENAERAAQNAAAKRAPIIAREQAASVQAGRAVRRAMWNQHEKFLLALAHIQCVPYINHPDVMAREDYVSWEQWQCLSEEVRAETSKWVDIYFESNGLTYSAY